MNIRISYIKRGTVGDGFEVANDFQIDCLPRIGEYVFLPPQLCQKIAEFHPEGMAIAVGADRRYEVVIVEHRWEQPGSPIYVYLTTLPRREEHEKPTVL